MGLISRLQKESEVFQRQHHASVPVLLRDKVCISEQYQAVVCCGLLLALALAHRIPLYMFMRSSGAPCAVMIHLTLWSNPNKVEKILSVPGPVSDV